VSAALVLIHLDRPTHAQSCGVDYVIKQGDSLSAIAKNVYGKSSSWTVIFYANQDRLGQNASIVVPGQSIRIPCLSRGGTGAGATEPASDAARLDPPAATVTGDDANRIVVSGLIKRIDFLTADDYRPFTDRSLPNGGMLTDVVNAAMGLVKAETSGKLDYNINWVNDWSAHLNPLLASRAFDMGFPWFEPPCNEPDALNESARSRCRKFFFSKPLFEMLILFFTRKDSEFKFTQDSDAVGKSFCRPAGYFSFDMDIYGRNWIKENKITFLRPQSVEDCFRLLEEGAVDAVTINEFTGRAAVVSLNLKDKVRTTDRPSAVLGLRLIVPKTHPKARILLHYVNAGLSKLRETGEYDEIVDKHLTRFWAAQEPDQPEDKGTTDGTAGAASSAVEGAATETQGSDGTGGVPGSGTTQ